MSTENRIKVDILKIEGPTNINVEGYDSLTDEEILERGHYVSKIMGDEDVDNVNFSLEYIYPYSDVSESEEAQKVYDQLIDKPSIVNRRYEEQRSAAGETDAHLDKFYTDELAKKKIDSETLIKIHREGGKYLGGRGLLEGVDKLYTKDLRTIYDRDTIPSAIVDGMGKGGLLTGDVKEDLGFTLSPKDYCMVSARDVLLRISIVTERDAQDVDRLYISTEKSVNGEYSGIGKVAILANRGVLESYSPSAVYIKDKGVILLTATYVKSGSEEVVVGVFESTDLGGSWELRQEILTDLVALPVGEVRKDYQVSLGPRYLEVVVDTTQPTETMNKTRICLDGKNPDRMIIVASQYYKGTYRVRSINEEDEDEVDSQTVERLVRVMQAIISTDGGGSWQTRSFSSEQALSSFEEASNRINKSIHSSANLFNMFDDGSDMYYYMSTKDSPEKYLVGSASTPALRPISYTRNTPYFALYYDDTLSDFVIMKSVHKREFIDPRFEFERKQSAYFTDPQGRDTIYNSTHIKAITPDDYNVNSFKILFNHRLRVTAFGGEKSYFGEVEKDIDSYNMILSHASFDQPRATSVARTPQPVLRPLVSSWNVDSTVSQGWRGAEGTLRKLIDFPFPLWGTRRSMRPSFPFQNLEIGDRIAEPVSEMISRIGKLLSPRLEAYSDDNSSELFIEDLEVAVNEDGRKVLVLGIIGKIMSYNIGGSISEAMYRVVDREYRDVILTPFQFEHKASCSTIEGLSPSNSGPIYREGAGEYIWMRGSLDVRRQSIMPNKFRSSHHGVRAFGLSRFVSRLYNDDVIPDMTGKAGAFEYIDSYDPLVKPEGMERVSAVYHQDELHISTLKNNKYSVNYIGDRWTNVLDKVAYTHSVGNVMKTGGWLSRAVSPEGKERDVVQGGATIEAIMQVAHAGTGNPEYRDIDIQGTAPNYNDAKIATTGPFISIKEGVTLLFDPKDSVATGGHGSETGKAYRPSRSQIATSTVNQQIGVPFFTFDESVTTGFFKGDFNFKFDSETFDHQVAKIVVTRTPDKSDGVSGEGATKTSTVAPVMEGNRMDTSWLLEKSRYETYQYLVSVTRSANGVTTVRVERGESNRTAEVSKVYTTEYKRGYTSVGFKLIINGGTATILTGTNLNGRKVWESARAQMGAPIYRVSRLYSSPYVGRMIYLFPPIIEWDTEFLTGVSSSVYTLDNPRLEFTLKNRSGGNSPLRMAIETSRWTFGELGQDDENPVSFMDPQYIVAARDYLKNPVSMFFHVPEERLYRALLPIGFKKDPSVRANFLTFRDVTKLKDRDLEGSLAGASELSDYRLGRKLTGKFIVPGNLTSTPKLDRRVMLEGKIEAFSATIESSSERKRVYKGDHVYDFLARRPNFRLKQGGSVRYSNELSEKKFNKIYFRDFFIPEERIMVQSKNSVEPTVYLVPKFEADILQVKPNGFVISEDLQLGALKDYRYAYSYSDGDSKKIVFLKDVIMNKGTEIFINKRYEDSDHTPETFIAYPRDFTIEHKDATEVVIAITENRIVNSETLFGDVYFATPMKISRFITDFSLDGYSVETEVNPKSGSATAASIVDTNSFQLTGGLPHSNRMYSSTVIRETLKEFASNSYYILEVREGDELDFFVPCSIETDSTEVAPLTVEEDEFTLKLYKS